MSWDDRVLRGTGRCQSCAHHRTERVSGCIKRLHCTVWDHQTDGMTPACIEYQRSEAERAKDLARVDRQRDTKRTWRMDRVLVQRDAEAQRCQRVPTANGERCPRCGGRVLGTTERACWACGWVWYGDGVRDTVSGPFWPPVTMVIPGHRRGD